VRGSVIMSRLAVSPEPYATQGEGEPLMVGGRPRTSSFYKSIVVVVSIVDSMGAGLISLAGSSRTDDKIHGMGVRS
jgi:hypothetical protein